jgi:hypothetical protein
MKGNIDAAVFLLSNGAVVDPQNQYFLVLLFISPYQSLAETPLVYATRSGQNELVKVMLGAGAKGELNSGESVADFAKRGGIQLHDSVRDLLEGLSINIKGS